MSDETKSIPASAEPTATRSTVPMWIIVLTLLLMFVGAGYFDRHSGWFSDKVYGPYASRDEVEMYQPVSGAAAMLAQGRGIYEKNCGLCHGTDGRGKPGQAPPLAGSEWVNAKGFKRLAQIPLEGLNGPIQVKGQQLVFPAGMVAIGAQLSDADLAAILTYIRGSWGNTAEPVMAADLKAIRASVNGHAAITGDELKKLPE